MDGGTPIDSLHINNSNQNNDTDFVNQIMTEFASSSPQQNQQQRQLMPQVQAKFTPQLENHGNSQELLPNDNPDDDDDDNELEQQSFDDEYSRGHLLKQLNDPALVLVLFIVFNFEPVTNLIDSIIGKYTKTPYVSLVVRALLVAIVFFLIKKFI